MVEEEYRKLRNLRLKLGTLAFKYRCQEDSSFKEIMSTIRDMMDDYLYENYTDALNDAKTVRVISNSSKCDFIDHMKTFVKEYKKKHGSKNC